MRVWTAAAAFSTATLWAGLALAHPTPFTFHIPEGWTDLSPGAPAANFEHVPPEAAAQARNGHFAALAIDFVHVEEGFADNLNAQVSSGNTEMTPAFVRELVAALPGRAPPGTVMRVVESGVVPVGGVDCGRLVLATDTGGRRLRQLMYFIPHGDADADRSVFATVTYTSTETRFAQSLPLFEAAARATLGAAAPQSPWKRILDRAGHGAAVGALLGALGGVAAGILALMRRRRKPG